jgi:pimeloyl-ACP methyl ester carboxylesterase
MDQEIRFCTAPDGVQIAYSLVGNGPPLVKAPNWLTHLEFEWSSPVWGHWWEELAQNNTLVRFDQRGSGLSERDVTEQSFDTWVSDLGTVVNHVGLDRFALLGISQGGAIAVSYAVRNPGRVSRMVLYGAYPRGQAKREAALKKSRRCERSPVWDGGATTRRTARCSRHVYAWCHAGSNAVVQRSAEGLDIGRKRGERDGRICRNRRAPDTRRRRCADPGFARTRRRTGSVRAGAATRPP